MLCTSHIDLAVRQSHIDHSTGAILQGLVCSIANPVPELITPGLLASSSFRTCFMQGSLCLLIFIGRYLWRNRSHSLLTTFF
jgi:hypothetical protein